MNILIVYESNYGQTEKIARRIAEVATLGGAMVTIARPGELRRGIVPAAFDRVVVAASVKWGKHQRSIVRYAKANREALASCGAAFLSVSGAAAAESGLATAREYVDRFAQTTGWIPCSVVLAAGGMPFTKLGWLTKRIVIAIDRKEGRERDPSRDYEFTDWRAIDRFAESLAGEQRAAGARA